MSSSDNDDTGAPLPDFRASGIQLQTVAPALGVSGQAAPDYLDYDPKGRGLVVTMFANAGMSYLMGTAAGGIYGVRQGLNATPSPRFRVQLNSVLNHSGRYGSRMGNTLGVFSVLFSLYQGLADNVSCCWCEECHGSAFLRVLVVSSHVASCSSISKRSSAFVDRRQLLPA